MKFMNRHLLSWIWDRSKFLTFSINNHFFYFFLLFSFQPTFGEILAIYKYSRPSTGVQDEKNACMKRVPVTRVVLFSFVSRRASRSHSSRPDVTASLRCRLWPSCDSAAQSETDAVVLEFAETIVPSPLHDDLVGSWFSCVLLCRLSVL
jgi:hypothetical protein